MRKRAVQLPGQHQIFLDHVAHFVTQMTEAAGALERLGFTLTPFTKQFNQAPTGPIPAGMANRCVMLREGYLEFLTAVSDTPLSRQFHRAVSRYCGLHLIAFSVGEFQSAHDRLADEGFDPDPPVHLRREVETAEDGNAEARFTVLRVPPEKMPEGRVQLLQHQTEDAVWQPRWMDHVNAIVSLEAVLLAVADPAEVADRYGRFTGLAPKQLDKGRWLLALDRGRLVICDWAELGHVAPHVAESAPPPPWIAGYALGSADPERTAACFTEAGLMPRRSGEQELAYRLPPELGGVVTVAPAGLAPSWTS